MDEGNGRLLQRPSLETVRYSVDYDTWRPIGCVTDYVCANLNTGWGLWQCILS